MSHHSVSNVSPLVSPHSSIMNINSKHTMTIYKHSLDGAVRDISKHALNYDSAQKASGSLSDLLNEGSSGSVPRFTTQERLTRHNAAICIHECWWRYRNKKMFQLLKHAVCAAERSMSQEVLRQVSPMEAELLSDKAFKFKVRFRFGGCEFPPQIYFKIFLADKTSVKYVHGKKMIRPHSEAAEDSLRLMGNRKYYDRMIQDSIHHSQHRISDMVDVSTLKDYVQYCSTLDETPSKFGGRDNCWRKLSLQDIPRYCVFRDIIEFLDSRHSLGRMMAQYPELLVNPATQSVQMQHIDIINNYKSPVYKPPPSILPQNRSQMSSRRSNKTLERAEKMRNNYMSQFGAPADNTREIIVDDDEDWEREASRLYQWTQKLGYDDLTPHVFV